VKETTTREFTFANEIMNVCWFDNMLHIDDSEDNSIVINKVCKEELYYLMGSLFRKDIIKGSEIKHHHRVILEEVNNKLTEILKQEEG